MTFQSKVRYPESSHFLSALGMLETRPRLFISVICMVFGGRDGEGLILNRGVQNIRNFLVFAENGRPHFGFLSNQPHFRHVVRGSSPGTRSLVLPKFSSQAGKISTLLLMVKILSN